MVSQTSRNWVSGWERNSDPEEESGGVISCKRQRWVLGGTNGTPKVRERFTKGQGRGGRKKKSGNKSLCGTRKRGKGRGPKVDASGLISKKKKRRNEVEQEKQR